MSAEKTNFREAIEEAAPGAFLTQDAPKTAPPNAQDVKMMRALVKLNLSRSLVDTLADDLSDAINTLEVKGPVSKSERKRVKTGVSH
jgi:hypothetical protein